MENGGIAAQPTDISLLKARGGTTEPPFALRSAANSGAGRTAQNGSSGFWTEMLNQRGRPKMAGGSTDGPVRGTVLSAPPCTGAGTVKPAFVAAVEMVH